MQSRDILITLALEYDLPTIYKFCSTSKRMYEIICNNNLFWLSKLKKDFPVLQDFNDLINAKKYYEEIYKIMKRYPNINDLYIHAIHEESLDLVKIALDRGADINYNPKNTHINYPLIQALYNNKDIFNYILEKDPFTSERMTSRILVGIIQLASSANVLLTEKAKIFRALFDQIFPKIYTRYTNKYFWADVLQLLEHQRALIPDVYERRFNELRQLAE